MALGKQGKKDEEQVESEGRGKRCRGFKAALGVIPAGWLLRGWQERSALGRKGEGDSMGPPEGKQRGKMPRAGCTAQ